MSAELAAHDVRFYAVLPGGGDLAISARCQPCQWSADAGQGHTAGELVRLVTQHAGHERDVLGQALGDAVDYRDPAGACWDCDACQDGLCPDHAADLDKTDAYLQLAKALGIEVDR